jgi:hypothetical protein
VRQRVRDYVPKPAVQTGQRLLASAKNLVQIRLGRKQKSDTLTP